jgi:hypothetical protein
MNMSLTFRLFFVTLTVCLLGSVPLLAKSPKKGEVLLMQIPKNYKRALADRTPRQMLQEFIPKGQNIKSYRELISLQIFYGGLGASAEDFAKHMLALNAKICPKASGEIETVKRENRYPSALYSYSCKARTKARSEWGLGKVIEGRDSLYVVIKVWKKAPGKARLKKWHSFIEGIRLCDTRRGKKACGS